jgi:hypothetical protein
MDIPAIVDLERAVAGVERVAADRRTSGEKAVPCVMDSSAAPIPFTSLGLVSADPTTISPKLVRDFLKPLVSVFAILWLMTPSSVWAFFSPLSEV